MMDATWSKIGKDVRYVASFQIVSAGLGLIIVWIQGGGEVFISTLWALACLGGGGMVGFLFGIPRVLQDGAPPPVPSNQSAGKDQAGGGAAKPYYRIEVNTNLEQISDWLTKIIVGIGLMELRRIPEMVGKASGFVATGLGSGADSQVFATALIVYFAVVGFLGGYLLTRIYLAQAFSRADWGAQNTVTVGGNELTLSEVDEQQGHLISDLQAQLIQLEKSVGMNAPVAGVEKAPPPMLPKVQSVLWVDDNPKTNSVQVEQLKRMGIETVTVTSTAQALEQLSARRFDRIISDMGRQEGARYNEIAGVELVTAVRKMNLATPIIIYCSRTSAATHGQEAVQAGASEVTSSPTGLLKALQVEA